MGRDVVPFATGSVTMEDAMSCLKPEKMGEKYGIPVFYENRTALHRGLECIGQYEGAEKERTVLWIRITGPGGFIPPFAFYRRQDALCAYNVNLGTDNLRLLPQLPRSEFLAGFAIAKP